MAIKPHILAMVTSLRAKVDTASEEMSQAVMVHEAWKPAAYDTELHERLGTSFATNTFLLIRSVLRREMLLAMMRIWDNDGRAVGMSSIKNTLEDKRVVEALVEECESHWINQPTHLCGSDDLEEEYKAEVLEACRNAEVAFAREQSSALLCAVKEAISIISDYEDGGAKNSTMKKLKDIRNERLAHRKIKPSKPPSANTTTSEIETFYSDMLRLIHVLHLGVKNTHYDLTESAALSRKHAAYFWKNVCGERTIGHPDYVQPPSLTRHVEAEK